MLAPATLTQPVPNDASGEGGEAGEEGREKMRERQRALLRQGKTARVSNFTLELVMSCGAGRVALADDVVCVAWRWRMRERDVGLY